MDKGELDRIVEHDREWRVYLVHKIDALEEKVDKMDKELATFKVKVFSLATVFGGGAGLSMDFITNLFKGG